MVAAGHSRSQAAKARAAAHRLEVQARSHRSFVLGGTVTAVQAPVVATDVVPAAPGTLTFVVHGGRWKVLRGATVTVTVAARRQGDPRRRRRPDRRPAR